MFNWQQLLTALEVFPIPVMVERQEDETGSPYYTYRVGTITPTRPFGYVSGMSSDEYTVLCRVLEVLALHLHETHDRESINQEERNNEHGTF